MLMKKALIILLLSTVFVACNNPETAATKEPATEAQAAQHEHAAEQTALQLNNGAKWKADSPTNDNVKNLQAIVEKFNAAGDHSLPAHQANATALQAGLSKMVNECRMQGADHDALHKWLEPLMKQVNGLKLAGSEDAAAKQLESIQTQLNYYNQYFE